MHLRFAVDRMNHWCLSCMSMIVFVYLSTEHSSSHICVLLRNIIFNTTFLDLSMLGATFVPKVTPIATTLAHLQKSRTFRSVNHSAQHPKSYFVSRLLLTNISGTKNRHMCKCHWYNSYIYSPINSGC